MNVNNKEKKMNQRVEAYGVRGLKSRSWRKVFKNEAAFLSWLEKNEGDVEVHGTRLMQEGE